MDNKALAQHLLDYAQHLGVRESNLYRVRSYRRVATTIMGLDVPVIQMLREQGRQGLRKLPGIGSRLAQRIETLVQTGEWLEPEVDAKPDLEFPRWGLGEEPTVAELLAVDIAYQDLSTGPPSRALVPILEVERAGWHYGARFATTALAHRLGRSRDWVEVRFGRDTFSGTRLIVTEEGGVLRGRRIVRGREAECRQHYLGAPQEAKRNAAG